MTKSMEAQGVTVDAAITSALEQLAMDRDAVSVEVIDSGKKGFLGIGATPARVRVTYETAESEPTAVPEEKKTPVSKPQQTALKAEDEKVESEEKTEKAAYLPGNPLPAEQVNEIGQEAIRFIDGLLEKLEVDGHAVVLDSSEDEHLRIEIVGSNMGMVIGRRGDTLDAIQYLTTLVANHVSEEHIRVSVDTEGYRAKRAESLSRLANKMAAKVIKYHKSMALEPMNPYERRVIHSTLQEVPGVTTYSTGTEPGRRVVIAPEGAEQNPAVNRSGNRRGGRRR